MTSYALPIYASFATATESNIGRERKRYIKLFFSQLSTKHQAFYKGAIGIILLCIQLTSLNQLLLLRITVPLVLFSQLIIKTSQIVFNGRNA